MKCDASQKCCLGKCIDPMTDTENCGVCGMLVKTRAGLAGAVGQAVKAAHSYTTPSIMVMPVEQVDPDYHRWIVEETSQ